MCVENAIETLIVVMGVNIVQLVFHIYTHYDCFFA
jgi:hypothetical protein